MWSSPRLLDNNCLKSFSPTSILKAHSGPINALDFFHTGEFLITSSDDESLHFYNASTGILKKRINSKRYGVSFARFTHHPTAIIMASKNTSWDETIRYLSLHDNRFLRYFKGHRACVCSLDMSPIDDSFVSASHDNTIRLWDLRTNVCQGLMRVDGKPKAAFDPRGLVLATVCTANVVKLYDIRSYDAGPFATFAIPGPLSEWQCMKFSPDGKYIALSPADDKVFLLDAFEGGVIHTLSDRANPKKASINVSFSPDGQYILSGSENGNIHVWDVANGSSVTTFQSHKVRTGCVMWNPKSMFIASGDIDGELIFWVPLITSNKRHKK